MLLIVSLLNTSRQLVHFLAPQDFEHVDDLDFTLDHAPVLPSFGNTSFFFTAFRE